MLVPKAEYPSNSTFGQRIKSMQDGKLAVAREVVKRFLRSGQSAFISDGTSTFYVALAMFEAAKQQRKPDTPPYFATIYTNHLAIAHEFALWNDPLGMMPGVHVHLNSGEVNSDRMQVSGDRAASEVKRVCAKVQVAVLSVRALDAKEGPAGIEPYSLQIKQAAVEGARRVVFVADHEKLSREHPLDFPLVYATPDDWTEVMSRESTFVVSTRHPDVSNDQKRNPPPNPRTERDWYLWNRFRLHEVMHPAGKPNRFIEVNSLA